jgi:succinoglycan biosynthesis transport protein ExoP
MAHSENTLHFSEYFRIIRNRLWVIFTIFALTLLTGIFVTVQVLPKSYISTAEIRIQSAANPTVTPIDGAGLLSEHDIGNYEFETQYERIMSPTVLEPVITSLGLDKTWANRYSHSTFDKLPMQDALAFLTKSLSVTFKHGSNLVEIAARSEDPKEATAIANEVVKSYKSIRDGEQQERSANGTQVLQGQIVEQQKIVADKKAYREQLRDDLAKQGVILPPSASYENEGSFTTSITTELSSRQHDLLEAQQDSGKRRVLYNSTKNLPDDAFISTLEGMNRASGNLTSLQNDVLTSQSNIENLLKQGFGPDNPHVEAAQAELDQQRTELASLVAGARNALKIDADMADSSVAQLQGIVDGLEKKNAAVQSTAIVPFFDADHDYSKAQALLDTLNVKLREAKSDLPLLESAVKIIAPAEVPDAPSSPNVNVNFAISAFAGLFCGIVVAFLIEYLDTSVKTMADAEQLLGLPVLTVIPNKGGPMPLTQQAARLPHAEGYRILRAKLNLKVQNGLGPSVTMLSGGPSEGKSTTIYNLAIVCAQAGQSVILVDCDLRRPTLHDLLDVPNDVGVSNYLRNEGDSLEFIQQTALPKLHVLTAGETPMSDIGNLSGDKIRSMLDELKQRYDLVLIDAPPVLGISDGSIIAREADYVILVIQHRRYPGEISLRAKRAIEEVHGNCVGMVLNAVAVQSDDSYYYYSNYGNYYQKDGKKRRKKKVSGTVNGNGLPEGKAVRVGHVDHEEF